MSSSAMSFQQDASLALQEIAAPEKAAPIVTEERDVGIFSLQRNPERARRPGASAPRPGRQPVPSADVATCRLGCQNPDTKQSLLTRTFVVWLKLVTCIWVAFENVAPIEKGGHFLWIQSRQVGPLSVFPHLPQVLSFDSVKDFLALVRASARAITFFNSLGGGATVNHLHFHSVVQTCRLAIEAAGRRTCGKCTLLADYPANGLVFGGDVAPREIWDCVNAFQSQGVPFNLVSVGGQSIYLFPRSAKHEVVREFPGAALASLELVGRFITADEKLYSHATEDQLATALKKTTLSVDEILVVLGGDFAAK